MLLQSGLGWAAKLQVKEANSVLLRMALGAWVAAPLMYLLSGQNAYGVKMGSSTRFTSTGARLRMVAAGGVAERAANKYEGKGKLHRGKEGGLDLEADPLAAGNHGDRNWCWTRMELHFRWRIGSSTSRDPSRALKPNFSRLYLRATVDPEQEIRSNGALHGP